MQKKSNKKVVQGVVVSSKMDKTVVVAVERRFVHPKYKKVVKKTTKFYAHDEGNKCKVNDVVQIVETRPLSKLKRWKVKQILQSKGSVERNDTSSV